MLLLPFPLHKALRPAAACAIILAGVLSSQGSAQACTTALDVGFQDFGFQDDAGNNDEVTAEKPESKLWFHDGSWWASMWSLAGDAYHIHRLEPATQCWIDTGTRLDPRLATKADVLWDGQKLYVVSHVWEPEGVSAPPGDRGELFRYGYNAGARTYSLDAGFPVEVNQAESEALVLDKDGTGQLWVTWVQDRQVMVNHSQGSDHREAPSSSRPRTPPASPATTSPPSLPTTVASE
jgi:hypothetical protein